MNDIPNLNETADYLCVSKQTVYNMIKDGRIKAYKVGREWKIFKVRYYGIFGIGIKQSDSCYGD